MRYEIRPISDRTHFTGRHEYSPFRTSTWSQTLILLERELTMLAARDIILEADLREGDIRLDGQPRSNAKTATPAVRLVFESKHGPLTYATDRFTTGYSSQMEPWQHNVRAIALGLEALRKVDRYGITKSGEQYAGWKQIEAGSNGASHMTRQAAAELLERLAIGEEGATRDQAVVRILADPATAKDTLRHARAATHPDRRDGDQTLWDQVEQAARVLGVLS